MSRSIAIDAPLRAGCERQVGRNVWPGLVLVLLSALLVLVIAQSTLQIAQEAFAVEAATARVIQPFPVAELPREWRWERQAMTFDEVLRQNASTGRVRWLRDTPYRRGHQP
jgi:hypothetical protein